MKYFCPRCPHCAKTSVGYPSPINFALRVRCAYPKLERRKIARAVAKETRCAFATALTAVDLATEKIRRRLETFTK